MEENQIAVYEFHMRSGGMVVITGEPGESLALFGLDDCHAGWIEVGSAKFDSTSDKGYYAVGGVAKADCLAWKWFTRTSPAISQKSFTNCATVN